MKEDVDSASNAIAKDCVSVFELEWCVEPRTGLCTSGLQLAPRRDLDALLGALPHHVSVHPLNRVVRADLTTFDNAYSRGAPVRRAGCDASS